MKLQIRRSLITAVVPLLLFVPQNKCDVGSPSSVQQKFLVTLRDYFPDAQVDVIPEKGFIIGYTCMDSAGPKLVDEVARAVAAMPDIAQLRQLRTWGPLLGSTTYRYLAIGFPAAVVRYDVDSGQIRALPTDPAYGTAYRQRCGLPAIGSDETQTQHAYMGLFRIYFAKPYYGHSSIAGWDTLGIYNAAEFQKRRDLEIASRIAIIRQEVTDLPVQVTDVQLERIDSMPLPSEYTRPVN